MASGAEGNADTSQQLKLLKYSRRGKKGSITKRIAQLEKLMEEGGKKKMIRFLVDALDKVYLELEQVCTEIAILTPESEEDEYNDIEDVRLRVETINGLVAAHLDERAEESLSASSLTSSWVRKHAAGKKSEASDGSASSADKNVGHDQDLTLVDTPAPDSSSEHVTVITSSHEPTVPVSGATSQSLPDIFSSEFGVDNSRIRSSSQTFPEDFFNVSSDNTLDETVRDAFHVSDNIHSMTPQVVRKKVPAIEPDIKTSLLFSDADYQVLEGGEKRGVVIPPAFSSSSPWRETQKSLDGSEADLTIRSALNRMNISGTIYEPGRDSVPHTTGGDITAPLIPPTWSTSLANTFSNLTNNSSFAGLKFSNLGDTRSRHNTSSLSGPRVSGLDNTRSRSSSLINMPSFSGPRLNHNNNPSSVGSTFPNPLFTGPNVLMFSDLDNTRSRFPYPANTSDLVGPRLFNPNENSNLIESNIS